MWKEYIKILKNDYQLFTHIKIAFLTASFQKVTPETPQKP